MFVGLNYCNTTRTCPISFCMGFKILYTFHGHIALFIWCTKCYCMTHYFFISGIIANNCNHNVRLKEMQYSLPFFQGVVK